MPSSAPVLQYDVDELVAYTNGACEASPRGVPAEGGRALGSSGQQWAVGGVGDGRCRAACLPGHPPRLSTGAPRLLLPFCSFARGDRGVVQALSRSRPGQEGGRPGGGQSGGAGSSTMERSAAARGQMTCPRTHPSATRWTPGLLAPPGRRAIGEKGSAARCCALQHICGTPAQLHSTGA